MNHTTDTPRTDAAKSYWDSAERENCVSIVLARELELELKNAQEAYLKSVERDDYLTQELAASQAEVERLQALPASRHKAFLDLLARSEKAEAEVKEIRNALGDKGQRTHKELLELASKASHWREWKEKYIDLRNAHIAEGQDPAGTIWEHADKIQQELKASKAEVAKLNHQLLKTESDLLQSQDINSFLDTEFRIACKRAEKAESEVERLDHLLADASETNHKLAAEVERLKEELELAVYGCGCDNYLQIYCDKHNPYNKTK
jgi:chromosome segregation ATPase